MRKEYERKVHESKMYIYRRGTRGVTWSLNSCHAVDASKSVRKALDCKEPVLAMVRF